MTRKTTTSGSTGNFNELSASLFLILLIFADSVFFVLHSINVLSPSLDNPLYSLESEVGYPEMFQYLKWLWIIILLVYVAISRRTFTYIAWGLVFTYFLFDDAFSIHEHVGARIAGSLALTPPLGLRLQDLGELAVSSAAGIILLSLVTWAYLRGSQAFRKISQDLLLLILALVFFGVVVDMAHASIELGWKVDFILGSVEDGGEMLVASLILWYVFLQSVRDQSATSYLCDRVRAVLTRRFS